MSPSHSGVTHAHDLTLFRLYAPACAECDASLEDRVPGGITGAPQTDEPFTYVTARCATHNFSGLLIDRFAGVRVLLRGSMSEPDWHERGWTCLWSEDTTDGAPSRLLRQTLAVAISPDQWDVEVHAPEDEFAKSFNSALVWSQAGHNRDTRQQWADAGITDAVDAKTWTANGWGPDKAREMLAAGVNDPQAARGWHLNMLDPCDAPLDMRDQPLRWAFLTLDPNLPRDSTWGALARLASPRFAALGHQFGQAPKAVATLAAALPHDPANGQHRVEHRVGDLRFLSPWTARESATYERFAAQIGEADWRDAALCLRAGMNRAEAVQFLRSGGDIDAVRVMAGLHS